MGTVTLVWTAAEAASKPLAYQRMESASRYLPLIFAWKVQLPPTAALPLLLICTEAAANTAVTSRFCLKLASVRVLLVTPSLHLTNTWPDAGTAVTLTDWLAPTL